MGKHIDKNRVALDADQSTWYTRAEAAAMLGCSVGLIRHYERKSVLHPIVDESGCHRFPPAELIMLQNRRRRRQGFRIPQFRDGELESRAYWMYDTGSSRNDVVKTLCITSELAQKFWESWYERDGAKSMQLRQQREAEDQSRRDFEQNQKNIDAITGMFSGKKR